MSLELFMEKDKVLILDELIWFKNDSCLLQMLIANLF